MRKNSLFQFFLRTFLSVLFAVIVAILAIYFYYADASETKIDSILEEGISYLEKDIKLTENLTEEKRKILRGKIVHYANEKDFSALKIIDNQKIVVDLKRKPLPKEIEEFFQKPLGFNSEKITELVPIKDIGVFLLHEIKVHHWKVRIILKIPKEQVDEMRKETRDIIIIVILTSILIIIASFPVVFNQYKGLKNRNTELLESNINTLLTLGNAIAKRDSDTNEHNYRVTYYSVMIAEKLGLDKQTIHDLIKGAFLHDVGKIGISDNILLKPGKLTDEEFDLMKHHVNFGLEIVDNDKWLGSAKKVIGGHHEKFDGSGYPNKISGKDIPLEARIFAVADVFDALTSERPYKKPFSIEKSIAILQKDKGSHFDPYVVDTFAPIAEELHSNIHNRCAMEIQELFSTILAPYFKA